MSLASLLLSFLQSYLPTATKQQQVSFSLLLTFQCDSTVENVIETRKRRKSTKVYTIICIIIGAKVTKRKM